jgi:hypothetical protein
MAAAVLCAAAAVVHPQAPARLQGQAASSASGRLSLSAHLDGLTLGDTAQLTVLVRNRTRSPLTAGRVRIVPSGPAAGGCDASNLTVAPFTGRLRLAPRGAGRVRTSVRLDPDAPDACQGALFPLAISASARP